MTAVTISSILGNIDKYKFNPAQMQKAALEVLRATTDGSVEIVDATNPFVFAMETTATNTAAFMQHIEALTRRQYEAASVTPEDLYLHMSDMDYVGRFAVPARTYWTFLFKKEELVSAMIDDPANNIRKITIPRNSVFRVAETSFSLQYPIDLIQLAHGGIQITYDAAKASPLQELETNVLDFEEVTAYDGVTFLKFIAEVNQFDIITKYNDVNSAAGFTTVITHPDQFYFIRVYNQNPDKTWKELLTTHTQQVYDPKTPTAVVQVLDGKVAVTIPSVYLTTGLLRGKIRTDVYYTKGAINLLSSNYRLDDFSAEWKSIDALDATAFSAPLINLKTLAVYSTETIVGGRAALSFDALRQRVIDNNVGPQQLPITNVQLQSSVEDSGYEIVKNVDTITNRIFLATKPLPTPTDTSLITPASSGITTALLSFDECVSAYGVVNNGSSVTITSDAMYVTKNGISKLVTSKAYAALQSLTSSQLCAEVNKNNYSYSPFHYVLDLTSNGFEARPYYLDNPKIVSKSFIKANVSTQLQVSIGGYAIIKYPGYYKLTIVTRSNDNYKTLDDSSVFMQLSYTSPKQPTAAHLMHDNTYLNANKERVFEFILSTDYDLDADDTLDQKSFMVSRAVVSTRCELTQNFNVFFGCVLPVADALERTSIDDGMATELLSAYSSKGFIVGVAHEKLRIEFGHSLKTLWCQAKTVPGSIPYQKYEENSPLVYEHDVFDIDSVTGAAFTITDDGALSYRYLHRAGDPILDQNGQTQYRYLKGETMLDSSGKPIIQSGMSGAILHLVDVFTIESVYRFASDQAAAAYRNLFATSLVGWLTKDLVMMNSRLLDQTKVYFYPKVTKGIIRILAGDGAQGSMDAAQSFKIALTVPDKTYNNPELLAVLTKTTVRALDESLKNTTVAVSAIESALRNRYGNDVVDVKLEPVGWVADYNAITVLDNSNRVSIKKRLSPQQDGKLIVEEDVEVSFVRHGNAMK